MNKGCQVCVIWYSNSIHRFIFKLCIRVVHTLKMCTSYFMHISLFFILRMLNLDIFLIEMLRRCLVCVKTNSNSFHSLLFKLCIISVHTILFCAHLINIFLFLRAVELRQFSTRKFWGVWVL